MPAKKRTPSIKRAKAGPTLLVGSRKGIFVYRSDSARRTWTLSGPYFLGQVVHHVVADPRDGRTWLAAVSSGHLGPTIQRTTDGGKTWTEAKRPPAFPKAPEGQAGKTVAFTCWLTPGNASDPGLWYAGVSPHALFRSTDAGCPTGATNGWAIGTSSAGEKNGAGWRAVWK